MPAVTSTNRGPLINVATWITLGAMAITVVCKLLIKWTATRKLQSYDYLMVLAAVFAIGQSVAISEEVNFGLGEHESMLNPDRVDTMLKAQYASSFLYISAVFMTKIASFLFFMSLVRGPLLDRWPFVLIRCMIAVSLLWLILSYFVLGFQCQLPHPWEYGTGHCLNQPAFWTATAVVDILTQIIISLIPARLLRNLQTSRGKRIFSMLAFTPNLLTIPLIVLRLMYIYRDAYTTDRTWGWYDPALFTSLHTQLGVLLGALPFVKPLIDSLVVLPAMIPSDDVTVEGNDSTGYSMKLHTARWTRSVSVVTT